MDRWEWRKVRTGSLPPTRVPTPPAQGRVVIQLEKKSGRLYKKGGILKPIRNATLCRRMVVCTKHLSTHIYTYICKNMYIHIYIYIHAACISVYLHICIRTYLLAYSLPVLASKRCGYVTGGTAFSNFVVAAAPCCCCDDRVKLEITHILG